MTATTHLLGINGPPGMGAEHAVPVSRADLFAGLCLIGFANGMAGPVMAAIERMGLRDALYATFGISAFTWIAMVGCCRLLLHMPPEPARRADLIVAACGLFAFLAPMSTLGWMALTGIALYLLRVHTGHADSTSTLLPYHRRAAWLLLATTITMTWAPQMLTATDAPLRLDALLVGWLSGLPHGGNTLSFADGSGFIWIEPGCSSFMNASIAFLCWVLFAQARGMPWSVRGFAWCLLACAAVIVVNLVRLDLIVLFPRYFAIIHAPGSIGALTANWLSVAAAVVISAWGTRHAGRILD